MNSWDDRVAEEDGLAHLVTKILRIGRCGYQRFTGSIRLGGVPCRSVPSMLTRPFALGCGGVLNPNVQLVASNNSFLKIGCFGDMFRSRSFLSSSYFLLFLVSSLRMVVLL